MYQGIDIDIVNVQTKPSREGLALYCEIKYKGKKIATFDDPGMGGEPYIDAIGTLKEVDGEYQPTEELKTNRKLLAELEAEFAALPPEIFRYSGSIIQYDPEGENVMEMPITIQTAVDSLYEQKEQLKTAKKGLIIQENEKSTEYQLLKWKAGNIAKCIKTFGKERFIPALEKAIKENLDQGMYIPCQDYYISVGVNPEIFKKS